MPEGPLGGPRPGASCSLALTVELNREEQPEISEEQAAKALAQQHRLVSRADEFTITLDTEEINDIVFQKIVVQVLFTNEKKLLADLESVVSSMEEVFNTSRISAEIEAV